LIGPAYLVDVVQQNVEISEAFIDDLSLGFSYPIVPFLIPVLIFLKVDNHLTPLPNEYTTKTESPDILKYVI
jgi:hypothetical protein